MPDVFTKAKRSQVMSRIRSRGNRDTELALAAVFRRHGITGWRRQRAIVLRTSRRQEAPTGKRKAVSGKQQPTGASSRRLLRVRPDFVFPKLRLAVFVDGCFWHACPLHATQPRNHAAFWRKKLAANQARDRRVNRALRRAGWRVLRIWEHELRQNRKRKAESGEPGVASIHPSLRPGRGGEGAARLVARLRRALA
jgi:DNA mismatch endonuclease (patch repair protein)